MKQDNQAYQANNPAKEVWREKPGDYYSDSIHMTPDGVLEIHKAGFVRAMSLEKWLKMADKLDRIAEIIFSEETWKCPSPKPLQRGG